MQDGLGGSPSKHPDSVCGGNRAGRQYCLKSSVTGLFRIRIWWQSAATPLQGAAHVDSVLENYAAAIRHVHDQTLDCINEGLTLGEARARVRLPKRLAELPYLSELYGRVSWSVNGIYRQYTGWYDAQPQNLNPGSPADLHTALVEAAGGAEKIYDQALVVHNEGRSQLALELLAIAIDADPDHKPCRLLACQALRRLAADSINTVQRNVYLLAAQEHEQAAERIEEKESKVK